MISVTIYRSDLVRLGACAEGLALYDQIAARQGDPEALVIPEWTPLHGVWLWRECHQYAQWLEARGLVPRADLSGALLARADLSGALLARADLVGADLRGADLRGANFRLADLVGADLRGADLRGANFRHADLVEADLRGADLVGADLVGADLRGADLRGADLRGAGRGPSPAPAGWRKTATGYLERDS